MALNHKVINMDTKEHPKLPGFPLLPTTVVGSYPLTPSKEVLVNSYYTQQDPYLEIIENCVREQADAGVQIISDGQTRANMVDIFASKLAGIRMKGKPVVFSEIRYHRPISLADQEHSLSILNEMRKGGQADKNGNRSRNGGGGKDGDEDGNEGDDGNENGGENVQLKGIITGPHTMALSVQDNYYGDKKELSFAFAKALNQEARALQKIVPIIQFDEPFFSVEFPEYAKELVEVLVKGIHVPVALHACGDVSRIFSGLVELPVTVLDHEFAVNYGLLDVVKDHDFVQIIGLGVVRSDDSRVESVDEIVQVLERAVDIFGVERLMVDPDCGLKHLDRAVAFEKLKNVRTAKDRALEDI